MLAYQHVGLCRGHAFSCGSVGSEARDGRENSRDGFGLMRQSSSLKDFMLEILI